MKKLMALGIAAIMLLVSFSMVSSSVLAEDITGPFMVRDSGYPSSLKLDQEQTQDTGNFAQVSNVYFKAQTFTVGKSGSLEQVDFNYKAGLNSGNIKIQIFNLDGSNKPDTPMSAPTIFPSIGIPDGWVTVPIDPVPVQIGEEYAIVIGAYDGGWDYYVRYNVGDVYAGGIGLISDDSGSSWIPQAGIEEMFRTYVVTLDILSKVAWHESGGQAFAVTGSSNVIYTYSREVGIWNPFFTGNANDIYKDIVYDNITHMFYIVGESAGWPIAYTWDDTNGFLNRNLPPSMGAFYGVAPAANYFDGSWNYYFLAVGETNSGAAYAAWWSPNYPGNNGWVEATSGLDNEEILLDVCWDGQFTGISYYAVGYDTPNTYGVIYAFGTPGVTNGTIYVEDNNNIGILKTIEWCPNYAVNDYCLIGGYYYSGAVSNLFKWEGYGTSLQSIPKTTDSFYDISWFPDGSQAVIVGKNGADGIVYYHNAGEDIAIDASHDLPAGTGTIYGVACKGPSSPSSAILTASGGAIGFFPSAADIGTRITANAVFPHLYWIGLNNTAGTSEMDQQVAVDSWYNFTGVFNYSQGYNNCEILVQAWHDGGAIGIGSTYPAETEDNRVLAFELRYNIFSNVYTIEFPGSLEILIGTGTDAQWAAIGGTQEDHWYFELPIYLGPQIRSADGNSFGSADPDYDVLPNVALLDADSWDFSITVRDTLNPTAFDILYGEFGVDKSVSVTVSGNPTGNAPPGSANIALANPSQITYSANTGYWVNVSIPNLMENGVGPAFINAVNVEVQNVDPYAIPANSEISVATSITAANTDMRVWGQAVLPIVAPSNGTVACGPWVSDYNAGGLGLNDYTILDWWISVPGSTDEGVYWATITITIDS